MNVLYWGVSFGIFPLYFPTGRRFLAKSDSIHAVRGVVLEHKKSSERFAPSLLRVLVVDFQQRVPCE
jgi:hypothetical protein